MIEQKNFEAIIQANSVYQLESKHREMIRSHQQRIETIKDKRLSREISLKEREEMLSSLLLKISESDTELDKITTQLEQSNQNAKVVTNQNQASAIEKEIESLEAKKEKAEEVSFNLLEKQEEVEQEISDIKSFLTGSLNSLNEITQEVKECIKQEELQIESLQQRFNNLIELCPSELRQAYLECQKRFSETPIAFIKGTNCDKCYFQIERNLESLVERGNSLEFCPGCGRLLAPQLR